MSNEMKNLIKGIAVILTIIALMGICGGIENGTIQLPTIIITWG